MVSDYKGESITLDMPGSRNERGGLWARLRAAVRDHSQRGGE
jgi:hypothetical protein